jgi:sugar phosphate isomerase/epimerase
LILDKLSELAAIADKAGMKLCMENESACNVADCGELAAVMSQAPPNVGMIWDVVNGTSTGETPFPDGYEKLDPTRIHHMHLKDVKIDAVTGERSTVAVGDGMIPYPRVFAKLAADGYGGALSMETHFSLDGSKEAASRRSMQGILKALEAQT